MAMFEAISAFRVSQKKYSHGSFLGKEIAFGIFIVHINAVNVEEYEAKAPRENDKDFGKGHE